MDQIADLELGLHRREAGKYTVEMRFMLPGSESDIRLGQDRSINAEFDFADLGSKAENPAAYGTALAKALFADPDLLKEFSKARVSAQTAKSALRVRLVIGPSAPELNSLYWESLRDPDDEKVPLFTGEQVLFSRYLSSLDWRQVSLRSKGELKALVAIANPSDLSEYPDLAPVDVAGELKRAQAALSGIPVTALPASAGEHCTLNAIIDAAQDGLDILYIVAHGMFLKDEPWLWLEDESGKVARVSGYDLAARIRKLDNQPRLVVLASCQSAGKGAGEALQSLGPRLAEGGVPAVVAMQGSISMDTVEKFMPVFFTELQKDGQIDRAISVARDRVNTQDDFWMPVLFMRLRSGRIWYEAGFGEEGDAEFKKWRSLLSNLETGNCTPILGGGLHEPLYGSNRDLALSLADTSKYPLQTFFRDALPQVTQYLSIDQDISTLLNELNAQIRTRLQSRYADALPDNLKGKNAPVLDLISFTGQQLRQKNPVEQHKVLAELKLPVYITTNYDNLMFDALKEAGADPQLVVCPWSDRFSVPSIYDKEPDFLPTPQRPLVYHLFGHFSEPDSMVLTEDDHFEFLIGVTRNKALIPNRVLRVLVDSATMFLGFQLDDWSFRIFFRYIMDLQGSRGRDKYAHIAVQVDPDEIRNIDPKRAREYLEDYFRSGSINIYWGQSQDFLQALSAQRAAALKEG
jgi:hypothetical protein